VRLLVTGGLGFIGSNFIRLVRAERPQWSVVNLDLVTYAGNPANLADLPAGPAYRLAKGDIAEPADVRRALEGGCDAVVNFAAETHVDRSIMSAAPFVRTNVVGAQVLLDAVREHPACRFVHVSTDEVYGSILTGSWDEQQPLEPNSPYSASKASSDLIARAYAKTHGVPVAITRCSNNYGPYQFPEKVIPLFTTNLLDGKQVPLYGTGGNIRDWLHVSDHCRGIELALLKGRAGEVYNIGGGTEITNKELTGLLLEAAGVGWDMVVPVEDRKGHDLRYSVDISKIGRELGYAPAIDFERGLADTVAWYADNRAWWEPLKQRAALSA